MRNAGIKLEWAWFQSTSWAQAGIKIAGRNINNLRYADDTTLMAESEEELKSLLMKVKEESEEVALKLNIQKTKIMASSPISTWQIDGKQCKQWQILFWGLQNHCRWWLQPWNEKTLAPWKESYGKPRSSSSVAKVAQSCPTLCDPMDYTVWNSLGQNTGVGSLSLL